MKKNFYLITLLLLSTYSYTQNKIVSGEVIDASTQQHIPYVSILLKNQEIGTTTNAEGFFKLEIPADSENDTLFFSCLNYQKANITAKELQSKKGKITLMPVTYQLTEVVVQGNPVRREKLGVYQKRANYGRGFSPLIGNQIAVLVKPVKRSVAKLKKVGYCIGSKGNLTTPFRIRIYESSFDTMPGNDLLVESIIVNAEQEGWFWYDVSNYKITIPENGIFVAMEWIFTDEKYSWMSKFRVEGEKKWREEKRYGQTVYLTNKQNYLITRLKYVFWRRGFTNSNLNAMIAADVDFFE